MGNDNSKKEENESNVKLVRINSKLINENNDLKKENNQSPKNVIRSYSNYLEKEFHEINNERIKIIKKLADAYNIDLRDVINDTNNVLKIKIEGKGIVQIYKEIQNMNLENDDIKLYEFKCDKINDCLIKNKKFDKNKKKSDKNKKKTDKNNKKFDKNKNKTDKNKNKTDKNKKKTDKNKKINKFETEVKNPINETLDKKNNDINTNKIQIKFNKSKQTNRIDVSTQTQPNESNVTKQIQSDVSTQTQSDESNVTKQTQSDVSTQTEFDGSTKMKFIIIEKINEINYLIKNKDSENLDTIYDETHF